MIEFQFTKKIKKGMKSLNFGIFITLMSKLLVINFLQITHKISKETYKLYDTHILNNINKQFNRLRL